MNLQKSSYQKPKSSGQKLARRLLLSFGTIILIFSLGLSCFFPFAKNLGWKEAPVELIQRLGNYCKHRDPTSYTYAYSYTVDEKAYSTSDCSATLKNVVYLPTNPAIHFNENRNVYVYLLMFALIGVAAISVALFFK